MKKIFLFILLIYAIGIYAQPVSSGLVKKDTINLLQTQFKFRVDSTRMNDSLAALNLRKVAYSDTGSVIASQYLMRKTAHDSLWGNSHGYVLSTSLYNWSSNFIKDTNNPILPSGIESSLIMDNSGLGCTMWYRKIIGSDFASELFRARATNANFSNWVDTPSVPVLSVSGMRYPYVFTYNNTYYLLVSVNYIYLYLYSSPDGVNWTVINGGLPVLNGVTDSTSLYHNIFNPAAIAINGWLYLFQETANGISPGSTNIMFSESPLSSLPLCNFDTYRTATPIIPYGGNPDVKYDATDSVLIVIHGDRRKVTPLSGDANYDIRASYAKLSSDLSVAANWTLSPNFDFYDTGIMDADPYLLVTGKQPYDLILSYNYNQYQLNQAYSSMSLHDLFIKISQNPNLGMTSDGQTFGLGGQNRTSKLFLLGVGSLDTGRTYSTLELQSPDSTYDLIKFVGISSDSYFGRFPNSNDLVLGFVATGDIMRLNSATNDATFLSDIRISSSNPALYLINTNRSGANYVLYGGLDGSFNLYNTGALSKLKIDTNGVSTFIDTVHAPTININGTINVGSDIISSGNFITTNGTSNGLKNASGSAFFYLNNSGGDANITSAGGIYFDVNGSAGWVLRNGTPSYLTVASIDRSGNALFSGTLNVTGIAIFSNHISAAVDSATATTGQFYKAFDGTLRVK